MTAVKVGQRWARRSDGKVFVVEVLDRQYVNLRGVVSRRRHWIEAANLQRKYELAAEDGGS